MSDITRRLPTFGLLYGNISRNIVSCYTSTRQILSIVQEVMHKIWRCSVFPFHCLQYYIMSDFLKKFKSVFIEEDTSQAAKTEGAEPQQTATTAAAAPVPPPAAPTSPGSVSDRFVEILASALEKNNQPGFDYFEFRQSLANLAKMAMDEPTRFKSAFAMAQTMGVDQAKLMESANFYLQVLSGEQAKFNEAHAQQRSKLIGNREEEVVNLENAIQQKTQQIAELTRQIEEHRQQSTQIRAEVSESTLKIEKTKSDFEATFTSVVSQLQDDVAKIKQYL